MATWREIIESDIYQSLPWERKMRTKLEFYKNVIQPSERFKKLSLDEQKKIETSFFKVKPAEGLDPELPENHTLGEFLGYARDVYQKESPLVPFDKGVEMVAQAIEPKVPAGRTTAGLMVKDLPRQMVAEIIRAYKPSTVGAFMLGTKLLKPAAQALKPVGAKLISKIPAGIREPVKKLLTKEFTIGKGQPVPYQEMAKKAQLERMAGGREAEKVAKVLTTKPSGQILTAEEQRYLGRIFRKETIESPKLLAHPKYQQLKAISDEGRAIMDKWSTELAKSGIPKEQTRKVIEENVGSYMARMYTSKLKPQDNLFSRVAKNLRLRLGGLKHRKDLSASVLKELGEIKEPALPTAIRVKETSANIANNRLFSKVAANPEWTATTNVGGNLVKMPDTPALGALRGKWVVREIAEDINGIVKVGEQAQGLYMKALSAWKFGKVVLNPATQIRNMISNTILLDMSGTSHLRQLRLFPRAFNEYLSKGKIYQQALEDGAIGGEFVGTETMKKLRNYYGMSQKGNLQRWMDIAKMPFQKAGELYQGTEQLAKMVKYIDVLEKGGTRELAAKEAQKWLFNYNEIPKFIEWARKSPVGAPFITFTYKSVPRIGEALVNRPMTLYKYYALSTAFNETSRKYQGMLPTDFARQKKVLPEWLMKDIGGMPTNLLLPWKDKYGRTQWLNLEYILPIGMAPEILQKGLLEGGIGNPLFTVLADLQKNSDFRGEPIIPVGATKAEATKAAMSYIYRQLVPSLAPGIPGLTKGGYSFEKIIDAIAKRPDFAERTRDLTPTLFDTLLGLKVNPLDVDEAESFRIRDKQKQIEELKKQFLRLEHPAISEKVREKQQEIIFKKIQRIIDGL